MAVHLYQLLHALGWDGIQVVLVLIGIPHNAAEHVGLLIHGQPLLEADRDIGGRELLQSVGIHLALEVETALQLAALPGQLLRVGQYLLRLGGTRGHRLEIGQPGAAAQLTAAGAQTAHLAGLLAHTNLFHLDAHVELLGQHLNQRAEIYTVVGGIVKDGLGVVALVLHIVHLHLQVQVLGNATGFEQGLVLVLQAGHPTLQVGALGPAEQLAYRLVGGIHTAFLHLNAAHLAGQAHNAHIVSRRALHSHHVALGHLQPVGQAEEVLAVVLKAHLHTVERLDARLADAAHPVARRHLAAAARLGLADRHIAFGAPLAAARQEHALVVLHPRQRGVGFKVGVD